ncbi:type I secretion system permease/ATPase [Maritimibacter sp. DP1N21-5]|uniref:type I secretion system permease/ATPase n=1 Tax=Maritimibacter sp. DP1N21-5 TaxID=2836867 RepID=UPI001C43A40A|nr:type I secretion system permease/ATPase [Maritimibacter sp. DP1N21-5]MBV7409618.1 type I secretion system permease/ATPase [Maritimibacter sp. DP1N21-5]
MSNKRRRNRASAETVSERLGNYRGTVIFLLGLSLLISILALTGAFYMLQIYDRALTSGSVPTLVALSVLAISLYLFQGVFDTLRKQILVRVGARFDARLAPLAHRVSMEMPRYGYSTAEALERGRDIDTIRGFISGPGTVALLDAPWMPVFLAFVYFLHPLLGLLTLAGAFVLILITLFTELLSRKAAADMQKAAIARSAVADSNTRNADVLKAMGFGERALARYAEANSQHLRLHTRASDISGTFGSFSRVLRMMLQSGLLGLGAYLTIRGQLSPGAIIACSVASSRALAPIDAAIGNWKGFTAARRSLNRLKDTLASLDLDDDYVELPAPTQNVKLEGVTVVAPVSGAVLVSDVSFALEAGDAVGLIGPSGGGKTSLAKAIVGIWPLLRGHVRLDDADLSQWREDALGMRIGYLPQDVALMDGTVAENISRFDPKATNDDIIAAAKVAGVHDMIVRLTDGYQTPLGPQGMSLSAGQRQRIGLARALYRDPFLVVLDEPNSNLDSEGDKALTEALQTVRSRGGVVIVIAHRPSALAAVDLVGVIQNGRLAAFGRKEEILQGDAKVTPFSAAEGKTSERPAPTDRKPKPRKRSGTNG